MPSLFVISAPSGAGKTSLVRALIEKLDHVACTISHTTRVPRVGEIDGQSYYFVDPVEFKRLIDAQCFIEYADVFGSAYGTSRSELERQFSLGHDVVLEIDWQGARQVKQYFPEAVSVFIFPPSLTVLSERLSQRDQDSVATIQARMNQAHDELSHYIEYDYVVLNENFESAVCDLSHIVYAERLRSRHQVSFYEKHLASD
ncbi:MAG: guanylate kinase [Legionellales bacterium]|nr:guanylate kinase [Legionellales bacterium]|tara:strand:+ start:22 stop:624 length:603 start_codon:yes stop_codon:yes gene_type:complete